MILSSLSCKDSLEEVGVALALLDSGRNCVTSKAASIMRLKRAAMAKTQSIFMRKIEKQGTRRTLNVVPWNSIGVSYAWCNIT